jgi:hypothetical protein
MRSIMELARDPVIRRTAVEVLVVSVFVAALAAGVAYQLVATIGRL